MSLLHKYYKRFVHALVHTHILIKLLHFMSCLHYIFEFSSTIFLYQSEAYDFTCHFPMNNPRRYTYMPFLCMTDFFHNNDVTLKAQCHLLSDVIWSA